MTLLIVEDNETLLDNMARSLRRKGLAVRTAACGEEARRIMAREPVEAVCLDLNLPDCHGLDLIEEREPGRNRPRFVVVAGAMTAEDTARAKQLGMTASLTKPCSLSDLHTILERAMRAGDFNGADNDTPGGSTFLPVSRERIARAAKSFATRRIPVDGVDRLLTGGRHPEAGDLVLVEVREIGQHARIELETGRRARLSVGDEIILAYGNRYAPDQFEGEVPRTLEDCHMVAAGGIAARCLNRHAAIRKATQIRPLGLLADANGRRLNLRDGGLKNRSLPADRPPVVAVVGSSMNAGKTTTVASLVRGLVARGEKIGVAKVTGTGAGGDIWAMIDAGGHRVLDFTDCGEASTSLLDPDRIDQILCSLVAHLADSGVSRIVLEIADGVLQPETRALLESPVFSKAVDEIVFAAGDALGAVAGIEWLQERDLNVVAISGLVSASPLAMREVSSGTDIPILGRDVLEAGGWPVPRASASNAAPVERVA